MRQESIRYCYLKLIFVNLLSQMTVIEEVAKNELELNWVAPPPPPPPHTE